MTSANVLENRENLKGLKNINLAEYKDMYAKLGETKFQNSALLKTKSTQPNVFSSKKFDFAGYITFNS